MTRKSIDCSQTPGSNCSLILSGTEEEVLKAAREHAISSHGHKDGSELILALKGYLRDEQSPPSQHGADRRIA